MSFTKFKGVSNIDEPSFNEVLEDNIITFLDWGFLGIGAFSNISITTSGAFGGDMHKLRPVKDKRFTDGRVWESFRNNWVWESGVEFSTQPIKISGIFIDNVFSPINSGYYIDYPNGRIVFDSAKATSSNIHLAYSFKWIKIMGSDEVPWLREGHTRSFRLDDNKFVTGSGIWNQYADTRIQLPAVAVEVVGKDYKGYQIGGGQVGMPNVIFHVLSEDCDTGERIANIISNQGRKNIFLYDTGRMASSGAFPLDFKGSLINTPLTYPDLIKTNINGGYRYSNKVSGGKVFIAESSEEKTNKINNNLYHTPVKWSIEADLHTI